MSFLGSGAGDLSTSTALPTRYLLYFTRLSRPTESRDWGEARAGKSLDSVYGSCSAQMCLCTTKSSIVWVRDGSYTQSQPARSAGPDTVVPGPVFPALQEHTYAHAPLAAIRLLMP